MAEPTILLLSTSDTDLISARSSGKNYRWANPSRLSDEELPDLLADAAIVVVRILGGYRAWQSGIDTVIASGVPTVLVSGEQAADAELTGLSTLAAGIAVQAHIYLAHGGVENLRQLHAFLADTVLMTGFGFAPPVVTPTWGELPRPNAKNSDGPAIALLYYRAQHLAGNTGYIEALCQAIEDAGARPMPIYCASLRTAEPELLQRLGDADAMVVTVLAAGGLKPANVSAGGDDDSWNVEHLAALDIPILQGLCLTSPRAQWHQNDDGLSPLDVASQVAVPEFDGRIITVPFSFKEIDEDGLISYVADAERCARVAGLAVRHAQLRRIAPADKRVALVFSAYPTKHARIGNAVGLDTPASAVALLQAMREHGYRVGELPGVEANDGDAMILALIERGGQDPDWLTEGQLAGNPIRVSAKAYREWFATLPTEFTDAVTEHWGPPPGNLFVDRSNDPDGEIVIAALQSGNLVLMVQPPRGFGENPVAIYHDPDLPPSHHYLAAYHWLDVGFGSHAVVHLGKHGNLE
ncbi:cobaltochelatase subunit CobN, partial [Mycobacterium sp.]|uniref:cobaltochelatase subunit CobN n=1 Tax=Mycobacterium sp. TaxID=1785 RepID=UPI003F7DFF47